MNRSNVQSAIVEAQRFIERARALLDSKPESWVGNKYETCPWDGDPSKLSGAVKRASMDLTRALADMRGRTRP